MYRRQRKAGNGPLKLVAGNLRKAADMQNWEAVRKTADALEEYDWGTMSENDYMTLLTQGAFGDHYWASEPATSLPSFYLEGSGKSRKSDDGLANIAATRFYMSKEWKQ